MMRKSIASLVVAAVSAGSPTPCALSQTHKVEKVEAVVRAVGVYEWTGDLQKPQASRLIPVTVFINGELQDGSIYEPRPIPFALLPGNEYILQQAGVEKGLLELRSASKTANADEGNTDGWWGYGTFRSERELKAARLRVLKDESKVTATKEDADRTPSKGDPDRPTLRRRSPDAAKSGNGTSKSGNSGAPADGAGDTSVPADDPDRPVLKRHGASTTSDPADEGSAAPTTATQKGAAADGDDREVASQSLNRDPARPVLHRGRPAAGENVADTPDAAVGAKLTSMGAPQQAAGGAKEVHQMVAVSDAKNRSEHDFARPWMDEAEHKAVLQQMQVLAQARLAAYVVPGTSGATSGTSSAGSPTGSQGTPARATSMAQAGSSVARRRAAAAAKAKTAAPAHSIAVAEEDLRGYLLSYGGAPTYVYTAHTLGTAGDLRYVTVVAQQDVYGKLQPAFSSVTDAAHLDRTPSMRLVGVVDAEASNRASLLFELREQSGRQFALYRVLGERSEALFTTGVTP